MKEHPILFSGDMVRAILEGRKTQTRRIIKALDPDPNDWQFEWMDYAAKWPWRFTQKSTVSEQSLKERTFNQAALKCPYGQKGDLIWVKETFHPTASIMNTPIYRADFDLLESPEKSMGKKAWKARKGAEWSGWFFGAWKPSLFMPRDASRIILEVVSVKVERLQDISSADAIAEGIESFRPVPGDGDPETRYKDYGPKNQQGLLPNWTLRPPYSYRTLWEKINGQESWEQNPWVWVVEFNRIK